MSSGCCFVVVVDEMAARSVGTQTSGVVGPAEVRLVLGMACDGPEVVRAVRELTPVTVAARAVLGERATQLGLVPRRRRHGGHSGAPLVAHGALDAGRCGPVTAR